MPGLEMSHGLQVIDAVDLEGYAQASTSVSAIAAQTAALAEGIYDVWCDVDVYLKVAPTANDVTTSTGYLLRANNTVSVLIRKNSKIGAIAGGAGTLRYHKVA